jgi:MFS family permease
MSCEVARIRPTLAAFSANGLFAGLSGLFLATTLHRPSHALAGAALFLVFAAGVISQLATARLQASRVFALGTISMLVGLALLVTAVRLSTPSLALFLISGTLIGAGAGAVFKGTTGLVLEAAAPENRVALTSALLIALFVGLSIPVIGAGVALDQGATAPDTVLGFAILVALAVAASGWALLGRRPRRSHNERMRP